MTALGGEPHDEHHEVSNYYSLHVTRESDEDFYVWLNTDIDDFDGLCVGAGETRDEAMAEAVKVLEAVAAKLQESTPA